jgi:hypothetical protein
LDHERFRRDACHRGGGYECMAAAPILAVVGWVASGREPVATILASVLGELLLLAAGFQVARRLNKMWGPPEGRPRLSPVLRGAMAGPALVAVLSVLAVSVAGDPAAQRLLSWAGHPATMFVPLAVTLVLTGRRVQVPEWTVGGAGLLLLCATTVVPPRAFAVALPPQRVANLLVWLAAAAVVAAAGLAVNRRLLWPRVRPRADGSL